MALDFIVTSGWYSQTAPTRSDARKVMGDEIIRKSDFHALWIESLLHFNRPQKIFIVDSASPVPVPLLDKYRDQVEVVRLMKNAGHATEHTGEYSGWMSSVLLGVEYAMASDVEYMVYVEQDCLLFGEAVIESCIQQMQRPFMFGDGRGTPQPLQQSFFIVRRDGYKKFLAGLHRITAKDRVVSPERKFEMAAATLPLWPLYRATMSGGGVKRKLHHLVLRLLRQARGYDLIPLGVGGRARPFDHTRPFYFQHGTRDELEAYVRLLPPSISSVIRL